MSSYEWPSKLVSISRSHIPQSLSIPFIHQLTIIQVSRHSFHRSISSGIVEPDRHEVEHIKCESQTDEAQTNDIPGAVVGSILLLEGI